MQHTIVRRIDVAVTGEPTRLLHALCCKTEERGEENAIIMVDDLADDQDVGTWNRETIQRNARVLEYDGYITFGLLSAMNMYFQVTPSGYYAYAAQAVQGFADKRAAIERKVATDRSDNRSTARDVGLPQVLVDYVFAYLYKTGDIKATREAGGGIFYTVYDISVPLERKYGPTR